MMKIILIFIFTLNLYSSTININSQYNKDFINYNKNNLLTQLPIVQDNLTTLIGLFSPSNNKLIFEYELNWDKLEESVINYNKNSKINQIKNIKNYFFSEDQKIKFNKQKISVHIIKCDATFHQKNIFSEGMNLKFRYYLDNEFYTEIIINNQTCLQYK